MFLGPSFSSTMKPNQLLLERKSFVSEVWGILDLHVSMAFIDL